MEYFTVEPNAAAVTTMDSGGSDYSMWIFWLLLFFFFLLFIAIIYFYFSFSGPASELIDDAETALNNFNAVAPVAQQAASDISTKLVPTVDEAAMKLDALIDKIDKLLPSGSDTSLASIEAKIEGLLSKLENVDTSTLETFILGGILTDKVIQELAPEVVDIKNCVCSNGNNSNGNNDTGLLLGNNGNNRHRNNGLNLNNTVSNGNTIRGQGGRLP